MKIEVRQFNPDDAMAIKDCLVQDYLNGLLTREGAQHLFHSGPAYTALIEGKIAACAGLSLRGSGSAFGWAMYSKNICPSSLCRIVVLVKRKLDKLIDVLELTEIVTSIHSEFTIGRRYLEYLGFELKETSDNFLHYVRIA